MRGFRSDDLDRVFFDHGIGQQGLAHALDLGFGLGGVGGRKVQLDHLALADATHALVAEAGQGVADGL